MDNLKRKNVDLLVEEFWKQGYMTIKRKFGLYLPEPSRIGDYDIDIIARIRKNYAIGITISENDLDDIEKLKDKLVYLATRQTKFSNKKVLLFVGISGSLFKNIKSLIDRIDPEIKRNIKLFPIVDRSFPVIKRFKEKEVLFS
jgi:hypothetical protein